MIQPVDGVPGTPPGLMAILRRALAADPAGEAAGRRRTAGRPRPLTASPRSPRSRRHRHRRGHRHRREDRNARAAGPGHQAARAAGPRAPRQPAHSTHTRLVHALRSRGPASTPPPDPRYSTPPAALMPPPPSMPSAGPSLAPVPPGPPSGPGPGRRAPAVRIPHPGAPSLSRSCCWSPRRAGVVLLVAVAAVVGARVPLPGASTGAPAAPASSASGPVLAARSGFGIPTVSTGCPAASVPGAGARCPRNPECWAGPVVAAGSASARSLPCTRPHVWQTFAIAILLSRCADLRRQHRGGQSHGERGVLHAGAARVTPGHGARDPGGLVADHRAAPSEAAFDSRARAYRCLAHQSSGADPSTSQFGRQADRRGGASTRGRAGQGPKRVTSKVQDRGQRAFSLPSGMRPTIEGMQHDRHAAEGAEPSEHNLRRAHLGGTRAAADRRRPGLARATRTVPGGPPGYWRRRGPGQADPALPPRPPGSGRRGRRRPGRLLGPVRRRGHLRQQGADAHRRSPRRPTPGWSIHLHHARLPARPGGGHRDGADVIG